MQLLAEIDGFEPLGDVKIIGCTNRLDILDTAITRPGRLDRLLEVGKPDAAGIEQVFKIHTQNMKLSKEIIKNIPTLIKKMDGFTGAEIKSVCTESGYFAIRQNKKTISLKDLIEAIKKVRKEEEDNAHKQIYG
jgi:proteasome regulatory subunit